jgi:hypothetical protein
MPHVGRHRIPSVLLFHRFSDWLHFHVTRKGGATCVQYSLFAFIDPDSGEARQV